MISKTIVLIEESLTFLVAKYNLAFWFLSEKQYFYNMYGCDAVNLSYSESIYLVF